MGRKKNFVIPEYPRNNPPYYEAMSASSVHINHPRINQSIIWREESRDYPRQNGYQIFILSIT